MKVKSIFFVTLMSLLMVTLKTLGCTNLQSSAVNLTNVNDHNKGIPISLTCSYISYTKGQGVIVKAPARKVLFQDDHVLTFNGSDQPFTLQIESQSETVFCTIVPSGATECEVPAEVKGAYTVNLYFADAIYTGYITFE